MVRVRVTASVGLRALNRTPARPKGSQQDDRQQDDRRLDDRPAGRRKEPDTLNTLDPAYFNPPPPVDRQQGPDTLDAIGSVDQDPASSHHSPASDGGLSPRPAQGPDSLDALDVQALERQQDDREAHDLLDALDRQDGQTLDGRQGQDGLDRPAPRPTPRQRAKLFDAEQQAKDAKAKNENPGAWLYHQYRQDKLREARAKLSEPRIKALVKALGADRQARRQARRQADAGVRDSQPNRGLPKVVVYNGSPGPAPLARHGKAPFAPRSAPRPRRGPDTEGLKSQFLS